MFLSFGFFYTHIVNLLEGEMHLELTILMVVVVMLERDSTTHVGWIRYS